MSNLNDVRTKAIPIMLDKERTIKFDLNAYAELEEKFGSVEEALNMLEKGSIKAVRAILWAGLIHEDDNLTERQVGRLVGMVELEQAMDAIAQAIGASMPEDDNTVNTLPAGNESLGNQQSQ